MGEPPLLLPHPRLAALAVRADVDQVVPVADEALLLEAQTTKTYRLGDDARRTVGYLCNHPQPTTRPRRSEGCNRRRAADDRVV